jgi:hypothetical protein
VTRRELLERARLLSSARAQRFGKLPSDALKWWQQIETIAAEYDLPITWDEWHSITQKREGASNGN